MIIFSYDVFRTVLIHFHVKDVYEYFIAIKRGVNFYDHTLVLKLKITRLLLINYTLFLIRNSIYT